MKRRHLCGASSPSTSTRCRYASFVQRLRNPGGSRCAADAKLGNDRGHVGGSAICLVTAKLDAERDAFPSSWDLHLDRLPRYFVDCVL
jgi:hypothetical protein